MKNKISTSSEPNIQELCEPISDEVGSKKVTKTSKNSIKAINPKPYEKTQVQWLFLCSSGNFNEIKSFLDDHLTFLDKKDPLWGMSCLHWSIKTDNYQLFEYLLQMGADVNIQTRNGDTPMHYIERYDRKQMLALISLNQNLNTKIPNFDNYIPYAKVENNSKLTIKHKNLTNKTAFNKFKRLFSIRRVPIKAAKSFFVKKQCTSSSMQLQEFEKLTLSTPNVPHSIQKASSNPALNGVGGSIMLKRSCTYIINPVPTKFTSKYLNSYTKGSPLLMRSSSHISNQIFRRNVKENMSQSNILNPELAIISFSKLPKHY